MDDLVLIIPLKRLEAITLEWHGEHGNFVSPTALKIKLMDIFKDKLPSDPNSFVLGYIAKRGGKQGIEKELDLASMYKQFNTGETITLYCEVKAAATCESKRKRKTPPESELDVEYHETDVRKASDKLKAKHLEDKYNSRQLMLWGGLIVNNQWKSYNDPPLITGSRKIPWKESFSEAMTGAALAFAKAISPQANTHQAASSSMQSTVSPMSKAQLSSEYIKQLKSLQELHECGVLSDDELMEQKSFALRSINTRK